DGAAGSPVVAAEAEAAAEEEEPEAPVGGPDASHDASERSDGASWRPGVGSVGRRLGRRARVWASLGALILAAVAFSVVWFRPSPPQAPLNNMVVVLPFDYRGAPTFAYLGEGVASTLAADLATLP